MTNEKEVPPGPKTWEEAAKLPEASLMLTYGKPRRMVGSAITGNTICYFSDHEGSWGVDWDGERWVKYPA